MVTLIPSSSRKLFHRCSSPLSQACKTQSEKLATSSIPTQKGYFRAEASFGFFRLAITISLRNIQYNPVLGVSDMRCMELFDTFSQVTPTQKTTCTVCFHRPPLGVTDITTVSYRGAVLTLLVLEQANIQADTPIQITQVMPFAFFGSLTDKWSSFPACWSVFFPILASLPRPPLCPHV